MQGTQASARLHQIDGLRAFASCLVVLHHAGSSAVGAKLVALGYPWLGNWLTSVGASGVEMFFVLSGVVLLRPYLRRDRPTALGTYFWRRAERLWPPYLAAWLLAGAFIALTTYAPTWWSRDAALPSFALMPWLGQLVILNFWTHPFNFAWWSLSVELQFYLLVPLIIWGRAAFGTLQGKLDYVCFALALVFALAFGIPAVTQLLPHELSGLAVYGSCFMGGVLLARRDVSARFAWLSMLAGVAITATACVTPAINIHVGWGLLYFGWVARLVSSPPGFLARWHCVWLGERSYSLFLTHYTVFGVVSYVVSLFVSHEGTAYFITTRLLELPLALFVTMLVFHFVERRFATHLVTAEQFWPFTPTESVEAPPPARKPAHVSEQQASP